MKEEIDSGSEIMNTKMKKFNKCLLKIIKRFIFFIILYMAKISYTFDYDSNVLQKFP